MKATDLMIGDWVNLNLDVDYKTEKSIYAPVQVTGINKDGTIDVNCTYDKSESMQDGWGLKLIEPIPLTPEILKKNGFTKYDVGHNVIGWAILDDDHLYNSIPFTLTDNDFDTEPGEYKWGPVEDDREESFVREIGRMNYVHELQHLFKQCKIKKEIVL